MTIIQISMKPNIIAKFIFILTAYCIAKRFISYSQRCLSYDSEV